MNTRAAAIWLVILGVIAGATWLLLRPSPAPPPPQRISLLQADPANVTALEVRWPDGASVRIARHPNTGMWIAGGLFADNPAATWPVQPERIQALLRVLRETAGDSEPATLDDSGPRITITAGLPTTIQFAGAALGGQIGARVERGSTASTLRVAAELAALFKRESVSAWRTPGVFPADVQAAARISLGDGQRRVELRRGAAWTLSQPVAAPAEAESARQLIARLEKLEYMASPSTGEADSASPIGVIRVESEVRAWEGEQVRRDRVVQTAEILGSAGLDGSGVRLRLSGTLHGASGAGTPLWGPVHGVVPAQMLTDVSASPDAYLSRTVLPLQAADVRWIGFEDHPVNPARSRAFSKTLDGWTGNGASESAISDLLRWLTAASAQGVSLTEPAGVTWLWTLRVGPDRAGAVALKVGVASPENQPRAVCVQNGPRYLIDSSPAALRAISWLCGQDVEEVSIVRPGQP